MAVPAPPPRLGAAQPALEPAPPAAAREVSGLGLALLQCLVARQQPQPQRQQPQPGGPAALPPPPPWSCRVALPSRAGPGPRVLPAGTGPLLTHAAQGPVVEEG